MASKFNGFPPQALTFFRQLAKNNDREWFNAHKQIFEQQVRQPMLELVGLLCDDLRRFAVEYVPPKPDKAIFRIYRDTRFAKDKTPYKTHIAAMFQHQRIPKYRGAGFYFELSHTALGIAGGMYMPGPEELQAVRQQLATSWKKFGRLCEAPALVKLYGPLQGESLARVPKGFDAQSPAAEWLRRKQFYFYLELDPKVATGPRAHKEIWERFKPLLPMMQYLNEAVIQSLGDEEELRPVRPEPMF